MNSSEKKVVILGGGIAGLLAALEMSERINPSQITVLAAKIMLEKQGLHYLHETQETKSLIERLGINYNKIKVKGALVDSVGIIRPFSENSLSIQELIDAVKSHNLKTTGIPWSGSARSMNSIIDINFSKKQQYMLDHSIEEITEELLKVIEANGVKVIIGISELILPGNKRIQYEAKSLLESLPYDYLISTIPLIKLVEQIVWSSEELPCVDRGYSNLKSAPIYTRLVEGDKVQPDLLEYDFVYNPYGSGWYRASRITMNKSRYVQFEFSSKLYANDFRRIPAESEFNSYGHIYAPDPKPVLTILDQLERKSIYCIGRAGRWNTGALVQQTSKEAKRTAECIANQIKDE